MPRYYLDVQFRDSYYKDTYYSYENGAYDGKYFDSKEEAEKYAKENQCFLGENDVFEIMEEEEEND